LSQIPQKTKKEDSSRVYEFKKTKFNIAGLSPFLENYLVRPDQTENQTGAVCSWQPIVDRTEIVGESDKKSLHQILIESRAKGINSYLYIITLYTIFKSQTNEKNSRKCDERRRNKLEKISK